MKRNIIITSLLLAGCEVRGRFDSRPVEAAKSETSTRVTKGKFRLSPEPEKRLVRDMLEGESARAIVQFCRSGEPFINGFMDINAVGDRSSLIVRKKEKWHVTISAADIEYGKTHRFDCPAGGAVPIDVIGAEIEVEPK